VTRSAFTRLGAALACGVALGIGGCGDGSPKTPPAPVSRFTDAEFVRRFHAGVVELEQHRFLDAAKTFAELTQDRPRNLASWINLAEAELNRNTPESHPFVEAAVAGALAVDPDDPQAHFIRGILHKHLGEFEQAEARFRAALKKAPADPTLNYQLATVLSPERSAEAIALLETCLAGQTHLSSAYYRLAEVKGRTDREARTAALAAFKTFEDAETGNKAGIVYTEMGRLGEANRDPGIVLPPPPAPPAVADYASPVLLPGRVAAVAATGPVTVAAEVALARTADWDQDGAEDLTVLAGGKIQVRKGLDPAGPIIETPAALGPAAAFTWSDVDQDADLDLVVARYDGSVVCGLNLRDGKDGFAVYDPATWLGGRIRAALPSLPAAATAVAASDLDGDGDPDLVFAGAFGLRVWRNDRLMRFADATEAAGLAGLPACRAFLVEDLSGDRAFDVVALGVDGRPFVFVQATKGSFTLTFAKSSGSLDPFAPIHALRVGDFDLDGEDDLVLAAGNRLIVMPRGAAAAAAGRPPEGARTLTFDQARTLIAADLNGDCALDLVVGDAEGRSWRVDASPPPAGRHALAVRLQGRIEPAKMRANTGGVGARVETTAGARTRVREVRAGDGMPGQGPTTLHFGLGEAGVADYVRVNWPDDVLQIEGPVPAGACGAPKVIEENQRKASSCPLVFVWNGERYEFVTDFLGVGGLGFLLEPGVYAPPDPTEKLLLPPIATRDGRLDLVIHEPFEEVCYLDRAALAVVDHPADVEIVPDERFAVNAPASDGRLFAVRDRLFPQAALDGRGRDVLAATAKVDRRYASAEPDPRFLGWAEPTTFVFDFGRAFAAWAGRDDAVLALDGWVEYPYSHIVLAAAQRRLKLEPLSVDVETKDGGFVTLAPEAAYPAGMPRTMTLPLPVLPANLTGRLRLRTNQELHIDRLSVFRPVDVPLVVRTLEPSEAELRPAGFPREYSPDGRAPRLYDYDVMDKTLQFKTLAGAFTRFGDVKELLGVADDRYVVFAGGEEIRASYPAPPPPAAGMRRTFVLDSVGWCKDMDPHTAAPYTVEPLPFLGMSGYPYPAEERFPRTPAHDDWAARYQTRILPGTRAGR
jgi:hypothetical protein